MDYFTVVEDCAVVLRCKGVYRQAKLYRRGQDAFAQWGAGFVRLLPRGGTTLPNVTWLETDAIDFIPSKAKFHG